MTKITLDAKTFQALASSTRLTVLRALDERRKTLTELARDMQLNKATVHEHLQLLTGAGLVRKRDDEGRKWIYYELTWTGEKLLHPQETTTFNVLLALSVAAAGGGVAMLGRALNWWLVSQPAPSDNLSKVAPAGTEADQGAPAAMGATSEPSGTASPSGGGAGGGQQGAPPPESPAAEDTAMADQLPEEASASKGPDGFPDDDGWLAIVLLVAASVFTFLAVAMRRHLRPGKFVPPSGPEEGAEGEPPAAPPQP